MDSRADQGAPSRPGGCGRRWRRALLLVAGIGLLAPASAGAVTITVTTAGDETTQGDHLVSLREAITAIDNASNGGDTDLPATGYGTNDTIVFNIPTSGLKTIPVGGPPANLHTVLPPLMKPMTINGASQPGATGSPAVGIALDGTQATGGTLPSGFTIDTTTGYSTIQGFNLRSFPVAGVLGLNGSATITGNLIGTDATGTGPAGNQYGFFLQGGNLNISGNVISGNSQDGVLIFNNNNNVILGNYIGTDTSGTLALGNGRDGIRVQNGQGTQIGQTGAGNLILNNTGFGINFLVPGNQAFDNSIFGNVGGGINVPSADTSFEPHIAVDPTTGNLVVTFTDAQPGSTVSGQFFSNPDCGSGAQFRTFLGEQTGTADGSGNGQISFHPPSTPATGSGIKATVSGMINGSQITLPSNNCAPFMPSSSGGGPTNTGLTPLDIAAGYDLFQTDPSGTSINFGNPPFTLPPGLFRGFPGFTGQVQLMGNPLGTFNGHDVGDADTIVRRGQSALLDFPLYETTIPIDLERLNLESVMPIKVPVKAGKHTANSFFDVFVTLDAIPSTGQMTLTESSPTSGTFDSFFDVFTEISLVRLPDGMTKKIDVGPFLMTPQYAQFHRLSAGKVVWQTSCPPQVLTVPALNAGFCPGVNASGLKQPFTERGKLAMHTVVPAQPPLEHFKCYSIRAQSSLRLPSVTLSDQFGQDTVQVGGLRQLCAPAQKNGERFANQTAHLQCYSITAAPRNHVVAVRNQFGSYVLKVNRPQALCVPSLKSLNTRQPPPSLTTPTTQAALTDHFQCYGVRQQARYALRSLIRSSRQVRLSDQFGAGRVRVLQPVELCAPAQKNAEPIRHPVDHLLCYAIADVRRRRFVKRNVQVTNQFGTQVVRLTGSKELCVPSVKIVLR